MRSSLRQRLLLGILLPVLALLLAGSWTLYRQALRAADTAYDRTLLASAKAIGELLEVTEVDGRLRLTSNVLYSALEAFEADNRSRIFYKVSGFGGEMVSGFEDLPAWRGTIPVRSVYAALVHFYDDRYRGEPVRVAVLLQPVAGVSGQGMATIQVAETLELRHTLARELLLQTAWQQLALVAVIAFVVVLAVHWATRPVRSLSAQLAVRAEDDLSPLHTAAAPRELQPMVEAANDLMARLARLVSQQRRFVRDASHQLRTPLAVLKTQVQSALRGDVDPEQALREIDHTVAGATALADGMLALARAEQLRTQGAAASIDWSETARTVALDLSPLLAARQLEFSLDAESGPVCAHEWALRELTRNLLHNAIRFGPPGTAVTVRLRREPGQVVLGIGDDGPGIAPELRERLFQPFARGADASAGGAGLGLAICREITSSLGGTIALDNRTDAAGRTIGLDVTVRLPAASDG